MDKPFILWLTLGLVLSVALARQEQEEGGESAEPPKSAAELLRKFRAEKVEKGKLPEVIERIMIRLEDLPGYAPYIAIQGDWRKDRVVIWHSFHPVASKDQQNDRWKKRRILDISYYIFDKRQDALKHWWGFPAIIQSGSVVIPRGTATGDPLGVELCWGGGSLLMWGYRLRVLWKDNLAGEVGISYRGAWPREPLPPLTPEEIYLVENVARKVLANLEGIPFEVTTEPPKDWIVKPVQLLFQRKPLEVKPKHYKSRIKPLPGSPDSYEVVPPKPALWGGQVYVAPPVLEALGLKVEWDPQSRDLDALKVTVLRGEQKMTFTLGRKEATMADGTTRPLEGAPRMLDGFPVVPLEAVTTAFGLAVEVERPPGGRGSDGKRDGNTPVNPPPSQGFGGASPQGSPPARSSYWA